MALTVQEQIAKLLWNQRYLIIPSDIERPNDCDILILQDPTLEDRNHYVMIRELEEIRATQEGVPNEEQIMESAKIGGLWTDHDDLVLQKIDSHIALLENEVRKQKFDIKKKKLKAQIEEAKQQKKDVTFKIDYIKSQTVEYLAHEIAIFDLMQRVVFKHNGHKLWASDIEFLFDKNNYTNFVYYIAKSVLSDDVWPEKEIRKVAKNPEWRMFWTLNRENLTSVFNKSIGELNLNQKLLVYWSRVYDNAFESMDKPDFDIVQDDEKFDNWLLNREQERKEPATNNKNKNATEEGFMLDGEYCEICTCGALEKKGKGLGETPYHPASCSYGRFRKYTEEEKEKIAAEIYSKNSDKMRKFMSKEIDKIEKAGLIQEHHLRDKNARKILGAKSNIIPIYKR